MRETERNRLWEQYRKKKTPQLREQLILEYAGVVNLVAGRLSMYLGYTVEYDDLVGYGIFGLIDAIDKYDIEKNVKFCCKLLGVCFVNIAKIKTEGFT